MIIYASIFITYVGGIRAPRRAQPGEPERRVNSQIRQRIVTHTNGETAGVADPRSDMAGCVASNFEAVHGGALWLPDRQFLGRADKIQRQFFSGRPALKT